MIAPILAVLLQVQGGWTTVWEVRLTWEASPTLWVQTGISTEEPEGQTTRAAAVALRDEILAHGWAWPAFRPGEPDPELRGETRVAPGAIRYCSVKRSLCRLDLPPQERPPCQYPDGDPPGVP